MSNPLHLNDRAKALYTTKRATKKALKVLHSDIESYIRDLELDTVQVNVFFTKLPDLPKMTKTKFKWWHELYEYDNRATIYMANALSAKGLGTEEAIQFLKGLSDPDLDNESFKMYLSVRGKRKPSEVEAENRALKKEIAKLKIFIKESL